MKKVTLDTAKKIIGGAECSYSYDLVSDVCVQTSSCTVPTKYGLTATNVTKKDVASSYCGVEPQA